MRKICPSSEGGCVVCESEAEMCPCEIYDDVSVALRRFHLVECGTFNSSKSAHLPDCTKTAAGEYIYLPRLVWY